MTFPIFLSLSFSSVVSPSVYLTPSFVGHVHVCGYRLPIFLLHITISSTYHDCRSRVKMTPLSRTLSLAEPNQTTRLCSSLLAFRVLLTLTHPTSRYILLGISLTRGNVKSFDHRRPTFYKWLRSRRRRILLTYKIRYITNVSARVSSKALRYPRVIIAYSSTILARV